MAGRSSVSLKYDSFLSEEGVEEKNQGKHDRHVYLGLYLQMHFQCYAGGCDWLECWQSGFDPWIIGLYEGLTKMPGVLVEKLNSLRRWNGMRTMKTEGRRRW